MADAAGFHAPDLVFLLFSYDDKEVLMRSLKKLFFLLLVVTFCMESGCGAKVPAAIETISEEAIYVNRAKSWFGDFPLTVMWFILPAILLFAMICRTGLFDCTAYSRMTRASL